MEVGKPPTPTLCSVKIQQKNCSTRSQLGMTVLDNIYKYCLGWLVSLFWPYGWLLSPHHFCKLAPVTSTSLSDQPVSVTRDIIRGPIKRLNSDGSSSELFMPTQLTQVRPKSLHFRFLKFHFFSIIK